MATTKFEKPVGSETFELQQQVSSLTTKVGNVGNTDLQTQVTTLNSNIPLFRYGIVKITFDPAGAQTKTVTFDSPMNDSNYMVSLTQEDTSGVYTDIVYGVTNRTTTGFTIRSASKRTGIINVDIAWMAIEHI